MIKKIIWIGLISLFLNGCTTVAGPLTGKKYILEIGNNAILYGREVYVYNHPELSEQIKKDILEGKVRIGMTKEQVIASWGKPNDINRTVTIFGVSEQWVYRPYVDSFYATYLYFKDDILTSWQD